MQPFVKIIKKGMIISLDYFCETTGYLTFPLSIKKDLYTFYYDKVHQDKMLFKRSSVFNWLEELCFPPFLYSAKKENVFITGVNLYPLKQVLTDSDYQEMEKTPFKTLIPYIKNASIKDNVYLLRYTLK